jgi:hypothetical protein
MVAVGHANDLVRDDLPDGKNEIVEGSSSLLVHLGSRSDRSQTSETSETNSAGTPPHLYHIGYARLCADELFKGDIAVQSWRIPRASWHVRAKGGQHFHLAVSFRAL